MKKALLRMLVAGVAVGSLALMAGTAYAATPTVSLYASGNGNSVQVSVNADAFASVTLYYVKSGYSGVQPWYLGSTDASGYLTTTLSTTTLGVVSGSNVYVVVNGMQSQSMLWPYGSSYGGTLSLSQTGLSLSAGQAGTVTVNNSTGYTAYISSNSNSAVATASISGNQVTIAAYTAGTTLVTICAQSAYNNCVTLTVTVSGSTYNYGSITFSQNNPTLTVGNPTTITITGGYAPYTIYPSGNTFQSSVSGNTITLWGTSQGSGSLNVCSSGGSPCGTLYVTVNNVVNNYNQIYFSPSSVTINNSSTANVTIYGGSGSGYYISNNTNTNAFAAYISGSTLVITGRAYGSGSVTVCQSNYYGSSYNSCGTVSVTVNYGTSYNPVYPITFSQSTLSLNVGQSSTVSVYGGNSGCPIGAYCATLIAANYYIAHNSNASGVSATLSGGSLTVTGLANTASVIVVCSSSTSCGAVTVTVGQTGTYGGNWTYCASENGWCSFSGTQMVRYGANGVYSYRTISGGTLCKNSIFGDPIFGVVKSCYYGGTVGY